MINFDELGPRIILGFAGGKIQISESTLLGIAVAVVGDLAGQRAENCAEGKAGDRRDYRWLDL